MTQTEQYSGTERRARDRSRAIQLRRRQNAVVENERRHSSRNDFDIAAALELHLDQCKTRRPMIELLEQWLFEARNGERAGQDADYIGAVERAIEAMKHAPDVQTAITVLQRQ